jgi:hypothetical protein
MLSPYVLTWKAYGRVSYTDDNNYTTRMMTNVMSIMSRYTRYGNA